MIHDTRVQSLNDLPVRAGEYVLYWMQASQRAECNHALQYAIRRANGLGKPVVVGFGLTEDYPEANARHYGFMLEGLAELDQALRKRGIQLVVRKASPERAATELSRRACMVVADVGYFPHQRQWRQAVARAVACNMVQVESDVVVPVELVSDKEEYAARTIRPKIHRHLADYLVPLREVKPQRDSLRLRFRSADVSDPLKALSRLRVDRSVGPSPDFRGGASQARRLFDDFLAHRLERYHKLRNEPVLNHVSHMSPYLHFGQVSPLELALRASEHTGEGPDAFIEELVVRRELSINFVSYNADHASYDCLPQWARKTLDEHRLDPRPAVYTDEQLEGAETHDPYWNAAQTEMILSGKMHNYMRMYWGKKIIEWTEDPRAALDLMLRLNNRYELDGRDPNSCAGVAWCFGKHDRPWAKRPVFGTVRYMNSSGLERKFDMQAYVDKIASWT